MVINVNVQLEDGDNMAYTPDAAAMQVLVALGGNAQNDSCRLFIAGPVEPGHAGKPITGPPAADA